MINAHVKLPQRDKTTTYIPSSEKTCYVRMSLKKKYSSFNTITYLSAYIMTYPQPDGF